MKRILTALALLLPLTIVAQDNYSTWTEIELEKDLTKQWSVGVGAEMRTRQKARVGLSAGLSYKPIKYVKFAVGYSFLDRYKAERYEDHYKGDIVEPERWNGFNLRDSYWQMSHRATADVVGTVKLWKWLRISLRERYQFTHRVGTTVNDYKERYDVENIYDGEGQLIGTELEMKDGYPLNVEKVKPSFDDHVLRSRLKLEVDKKRWNVSPFISAEAHNSISNSMLLEKVRTAVGVEFKLSKHHKLSAAYVLTFDVHDDDENSLNHVNERVHAVSIGYNYKF